MRNFVSSDEKSSRDLSHAEYLEMPCIYFVSYSLLFISSVPLIPQRIKKSPQFYRKRWIGVIFLRDKSPPKLRFFWRSYHSYLPVLLPLYFLNYKAKVLKCEVYFDKIFPSILLFHDFFFSKISQDKIKTLCWPKIKKRNTRRLLLGTASMRRALFILLHFTIFDCFCQENLIDKSRLELYFSNFLFSIISILNRFALMIHSVLHFLQNSGKYFSSVSAISLTRVFSPHIGHFIHWYSPIFLILL